MIQMAALNAVCPYYTMYPLDFPLRVLKGTKRIGQWVLDPFCGRGTTNYAARLLGMPSLGFDTSPIAVAIAKSKLLVVSPEDVDLAARSILEEHSAPTDVPQDDFWRWAYHEATLVPLSVLRTALLQDCSAPARIMLRAIILGALHGPLAKEPSYFSNQCPRTFAPKPDYAVRFWRHHKMRPPRVDVRAVIRRRAKHYLDQLPPTVDGLILRQDSRFPEAFDFPRTFSWVITSPPYYGMRTYLPDQWLRRWFLGGPDYVDYRHREGEITHGSPKVFASQLRDVWRNVATVCRAHAKLVCRFGGIRDRRQDALELIKSSFRETEWRLTTVRDAGTALNGKRQAAQFGERIKRRPLREWDVYAVLAS
jgi:hypothetical protein